WLFKDLPYDVLEDLEPVAQVVLANTIFIVKDDLPVNSLDEFVQLAKQKPGEISVGSYGMGSGSHIFIEQLNLKKDLDLLHVPYKGVGPLVNAILGKEVDAAFADPGSLSAYLDSGKFKILAATGTERFDILPEIKTFGEHGMDGFDLDG